MIEVRNLSFAYGREQVLRDVSFVVSPGETVGIIGAGRIGSNFARKAANGFGMKVLYYGRHNSPALDELGGKLVTLDELLAESDYISLHVPLTPDTKHLL